MLDPTITLAVLAAVLGIFLLIWVSLRRKSSGLPGGKVIYTDTRAWGAVEKPLYDSELGLTGKPDYLVEQPGAIIPVEIKSRNAGDGPHDSHIYQLAAYCLLVQRTLGKRPPYGILRYADKTYQIDYTQEMETAVLNLILEMRACSDRKAPDRSHNSPARCVKCGYRSACDQVLQ